MTLDDFIQQNGITMTALEVETNPHMQDESQWEADHWRVTLSIPNPKAPHSNLHYRTYFSQGTGYRKDGVPQPPTLQAVLTSIVEETRGYLNCDNFDEWARDYGDYPETYKLLGLHEGKLRRFLGDKNLDVLLYDVERL